MTTQDDRIDKLAESIEKLTDTVDTGFKELRADINGVKAEMGFIKGYTAKRLAIENATSIASTLGLRWLSNFDAVRLSDMASGHSDLDASELDSFLNADLVIETLNADGRVCYVAVEVSFTAQKHDVDRAARNAQWLRNFTGKDAYAVIAGVQHQAKQAVGQKQVSWYPLQAD